MSMIFFPELVYNTTKQKEQEGEKIKNIIKFSF